MRYNGLRILSDVVARKEPGPASALNKMFWSEYAQRFAEIVTNIRGVESTVMGPETGTYSPDRWQGAFLLTRSVTIWGGTAQVQRNIVGERVLGLPKEPK
jgi:alkylation response protein AidB-like acyl-CoA dehydrogenase